MSFDLRLVANGKAISSVLASLTVEKVKGMLGDLADTLPPALVDAITKGAAMAPPTEAATPDRSIKLPPPEVLERMPPELRERLLKEATKADRTVAGFIDGNPGNGNHSPNYEIIVTLLSTFFDCRDLSASGSPLVGWPWKQ